MYNFTDFKEELVSRLAEEVGNHGISNVEIGTEFVPAPSGTEERLNIRKVGSKVSLSLKLNGLYDDYVRRRVPFDKLVELWYSSFETQFEEADRMEEDAKKVLNYEWAKDHLLVFAVPLYSDAKQRYVTKKIGSVTLGVRVVLECDDNGMKSLAVPKDLLEHYDITGGELFRDAIACTQKTYGFKIQTLNQSIKEMGHEAPVDNCPAYIVTIDDMRLRTAGVSGAVIAYNDFLKRAEELIGMDFFVIPSSVDDLILFPAVHGYDPTINDLLRSANEIIERDNVFGDQVMFYNTATKKLEIVEDEGLELEE